MNRIRSAILSGEGVPQESPIARKRKPSAAAEPGSLSGISIKREQSRSVDQRREDRHSAMVETAALIRRGETVEVTVVNASPGGLMIEWDAGDAEIGEAVDIRFADCNPTRCFIRWIRGTRSGLEFAAETTIIGPRSVQNFIIRSLRQDAAANEDESGSAVKPGRAVRHRMTWTGSVYYGGESTPVRIRNISTDGAMIECEWDFHVGTAVVLDLDEAGAVEAAVRWCRAGQLGLKFDRRFDLKALAKARPAPAEARPEPPPMPDEGFSIPLGVLEGADQPAPKRGSKMSLSEVADLFGKGMTRR